MSDQYSGDGGAGGGPDPGAEPTAIVEIPPPQPARSPVAAALLNLTGLAIGYAYLRAWWRFALYLTGAVALVVIAFATRAADTPWAWQGIAAIWLAWTAVDAWRLARRGPRTEGNRRLVPVVVGGVLVAAVVAGYVVYLAAGDRAYAAGVAAQARADCPAAKAEFALVSGLYELTLSPNVRAAEVRTVQCDEFEAAGAERSAGSYAAAVESYRNFRRTYPGTELAPFVTTELHETFADWGRARSAAGDFTDAIRVYRDALTEPDAPPAVRTELAATYLERAAESRAAAPEITSVRAAVDDLLTVTREFGDTPAAGQVPQAFTDTYTAATTAVAEQRWCDALPVVNYFVTVPDAETAGIVGRAHADRARSLYECGLAGYRAGDATGTRDRLDTFIADYPNDPGVPQARSAVVAATIAQEKGVPLPPLPGPLSGNSAGPVPFDLVNISPYEVRVLLNGPTTHEVILPPCLDCPALYPVEPNCEDVRAGKPTVTVGLQPGTYDRLAYAPASPNINRSLETATLRSDYIYWSCYGVTPTP